MDKHGNNSSTCFKHFYKLFYLLFVTPLLEYIDLLQNFRAMPDQVPMVSMYINKITEHTYLLRCENY